MKVEFLSTAPSYFKTASMLPMFPKEKLSLSLLSTSVYYMSRIIYKRLPPHNNFVLDLIPRKRVCVCVCVNGVCCACLSLSVSTILCEFCLSLSKKFSFRQLRQFDLEGKQFDGLHELPLTFPPRFHGYPSRVLSLSIEKI